MVYLGQYAKVFVELIDEASWHVAVFALHELSHAKACDICTTLRNVQTLTTGGQVQLSMHVIYVQHSAMSKP